VRTLDARADTLRDMGADVVVADMLDIIAVRAGMQGCSVVYFTMSISPNYLEAAANVAATAKSLNPGIFAVYSPVDRQDLQVCAGKSSTFQLAQFHQSRKLCLETEHVLKDRAMSVNSRIMQFGLKLES
jgi:hypothetical protein